MSAAQLTLLMGAVEQRPIATAVRASRGWYLFDSKQSAIAWSTRHAPVIPAGVSGVSAHPRARRTDTGEWALWYDATRRGVVRKFALTKALGLEATRPYPEPDAALEQPVRRKDINAALATLAPAEPAKCEFLTRDGQPCDQPSGHGRVPAKCPVCYGTGIHECPGYEHGKAECPGCGGSGEPAKCEGFVRVSVENESDGRVFSADYAPTAKVYVNDVLVWPLDHDPLASKDHGEARAALPEVPPMPAKDVIEKVEIALQLEVPSALMKDYPGFSETLDIDVANQIGFLRDTLVVRVRGLLAGLGAEEETLTISYPATWWQMFKDSYFPDVLVERFPVRYTTESRSVKRFKSVCPHMRNANG